ncbi:MAG: flippase [Deltaproteobacteria bacterium]|nr:flippase [Deltaproteobacteria bacterium]
MAHAPRGDSVSVGLLFNLVGRTVSMLAGGIVSILLARHFQAELFGQWAVASVYAALVGTVVDGGLARLLIRDAARDPAQAGLYLGRVLKGRVLLGSFFIPLALVVAAVQIGSWSAWIVVLLLVLARFVTDLLGTFSSALFAFDRFRIANLVETLRRVGLVGATTIVVLLDLGIQWAAFATLLLSGTGAHWILREARQVLTLKFDGQVRDVARDAFWFWASGIFFWINAEIDQLMLSEIQGDRATGIYAAAVRLVGLFYVIPRAVNDTVVRRFFRSAKDGIGLNRQLNTTTILLTSLGALIGAMTYLYGQATIELVYGASFTESGRVFSLYGVFIAIYFTRSAPSWYLTSADRVRQGAIYMATACVANIAINLYAIPKAGPLGAAWSTLSSEGLLAALFIGTALHLNGRKLGYSILLGAIPALVALLFSLVLPTSWPWWLRAALASIAGLGIIAAQVMALRRGWNPLGVLDDAAPRPPRDPVLDP